MKIIADDKIPFLKGVLEPYAEVIYLPGKEITSENVKDADAILTRTRTKCNAGLLEGSSVKIIASATIGYDHIDTAWCEKNHIQWFNSPGCNASSVAQYLISLLLHQAVRTRISLRGRTIGVIGVGNVGKKIVKAAEILGMRVLQNDPPRERAEGPAGFVSLEKIVREADFITFHVPLIKSGTDNTFHYADKTFFQKIADAGRRPFLINASRGEVVDNNILKEILKQGGILSGAALDVWENEPEIDTELMGLLDYATPHIAGYSIDGKANGTSQSVRNCAKFFRIPQLVDFYPEKIPVPEHPAADLSNAEGDLPEDLLLKAMNVSYDILRDDAILRASPQTFEKQRGNYPFRREQAAYTLKNVPDQYKEICRDLKFQVLP